MEGVVEILKKFFTYVLWGRLHEPKEEKTEFGISIVQKDTRFMVWHLLLILFIGRLIIGFIKGTVNLFPSILKK